MSAKRIYETDEVKAFAKAMSPISQRVIVTPEMKRSMAETKAEMDKWMEDPSFRAELDALEAECKAQDYARSIMSTSDFAAAQKFFKKLKGEVRLVFSFNGAGATHEELAFA